MPGAVASNGFVYVCGGLDANRKRINSVERYSPESNEWKTMSPMNRRRGAPQIVTLQGYIYAIGGDSGEELAVLKSVSKSIHNTHPIFQAIV